MSSPPALDLCGVKCPLSWAKARVRLEGLPRGLEYKDVMGAMREVAGVLDVHDLHIWSLGSSTHALSCHALIEDVPPSASDCILQSLNNMLCERFAIRHTTVQPEKLLKNDATVVKQLVESVSPPRPELAKLNRTFGEGARGGDQGRGLRAGVAVDHRPGQRRVAGGVRGGHE